jgi:SAM-dependent methyltransferase
MVEEFCRLLDRQPGGENFVEWGPGGGSNVLAFSAHYKRLAGVDISEPNLDRCAKELVDAGVKDFVKVPIDASRPADALAALGDGWADFFLSTAVFQHFPGKDYGAQVLGVARRLLRPDGLALIQTRYDDGSEKFAPKSGDYRKNAIYFTSYRVEEFWRLLDEAGFEPIAVRLDPKVNYAFYFARRRGEPVP